LHLAAPILEQKRDMGVPTTDDNKEHEYVRSAAADGTQTEQTLVSGSADTIPAGVIADREK